MTFDHSKSADLVEHIRRARELSRELRLPHLEYLLSMAELESRDRLGQTVNDGAT